MTKTNWTAIIAGLVAFMLTVLALLLLASRTDDGLDLTAPLIPGGWMAWTGATALFFWVIAGWLSVTTETRFSRPGVDLLGGLTTRTAGMVDTGRPLCFFASSVTAGIR